MKTSDLGAILDAFRKPAVRDAGGAPEGVAQHPDELLVNASLHILCKDTADLLVRFYPGFLWAVQPDETGGVINIFCLNFHDQWGYTIKTADLQNDPRMREVREAGGELLRRFHYTLPRFDLAAANAVPRGPDGKAIPDLSDKPRSRRRAQAEAELAIAEGRATVVEVEGETFLQVVQK